MDLKKLNDFSKFVDRIDRFCIQMSYNYLKYIDLLHYQESGDMVFKGYPPSKNFFSFCLLIYLLLIINWSDF